MFYVFSYYLKIYMCIMSTLWRVLCVECCELNNSMLVCSY